jgi:DNA-binding SARP family transcriptional activator/tetratricopeptide (TPR) repeat protein
MDYENLTIRLLGTFEVKKSGNPVVFPSSRKTRALLAYLVATGKPQLREHLCDLLWEGPADPRAGLRWSLTKLRKILNTDSIQRLNTDSQYVGFKPDQADIDLLAVQKLTGSSPENASTENLKKAAALFRGEFLEGFLLSESYRFDVWCTSQREYVRQLQDKILSTLTKRFQDEPDTALRYARERLIINPYSEAAYIDLIILLGETGNTHEAVEQYERCKKMLADELDTHPSPELESVRKKIEGRVSVALVTDRTIRKQRYLSTISYSLAGRKREQKLIENFINEALAGSTSTILLFLGEPGIGKTRMLDECMDRIYKEDGIVLTGRTFDIEVVRPYGPWIDALRDVPRSSISPDIRNDLAPLFPGLSTETSPVEKRNRIFDSVVRLLDDLAGLTKPLAVILDDIHWIDDASAALFHYIVRYLKETGIVFACSARSGELEQNRTAHTLINTLRREGRIVEHTLSPLSLEETTALVSTIDSTLDGSHIYFEGKGNPLYSIEIARSDTHDKSMPSKNLVHLIGDRLARLSTQTKEIIPFLASLGQTFDTKTLEVVLNRPFEKILSSLEELEQHSIIQVAGSSEYSFTHELVRRAAYTSISEPRRKMIHTHIAKELSSHREKRSKLAADIAHHAYLGGEYELAANSLLSAAQSALRIFAYEEVAKLASQGLRQLTDFPQDQRLRLQLKFLELYVDPGMRNHPPENLIELLNNAIAEAKAAGYDDLVWSGLVSITTYYYQQGDFHHAHNYTLQSEEFGRTSGDTEKVVWAVAETARCLSMLERDMKKAEKLAQEASTLEKALDTDNKVYEIHMAFGLIHHFKGNLDEAYRQLETALKLARQQGGHWWECYCHLRLPMIELERGRPEEALQLCRVIKPVAMRIKNGSEGPFTEALEALALLLLQGGKQILAVDDAIEKLRKVDSKWMVFYIQSFVGKILLDNGELEEARHRTEEALVAAEAVDNKSAIAIARSILSSIVFQQNRNDEAREIFGAIIADDNDEYNISARARREIEKTRKILFN